MKLKLPCAKCHDLIEVDTDDLDIADGAAVAVVQHEVCPGEIPERDWREFRIEIAVSEVFPPAETAWRNLVAAVCGPSPELDARLGVFAASVRAPTFEASLDGLERELNQRWLQIRDNADFVDTPAGEWTPKPVEAAPPAGGRRLILPGR